jgi:hypothetical protein
MCKLKGELYGKYYLNLTNGIEAFKEMSECLFDFGYVVSNLQCVSKRTGIELFKN